MLKNQQSVEEAYFGETPHGKAYLYTIRNSNGLLVKISNFGGIITTLECPDRNGNNVDVVLGFDTIDSYLKDHPYLGCIIGRNGNRIAKGKFKIGDQSFQVEKNLGDHHLHGGTEGFHTKLWEVNMIQQGIELSYLSQSGEEGYPGNLQVKVTYQLNNENQLRIDYEGSTDQSTICNLTNHSYFNLAGESHGSILDHQLQIISSCYTATDVDLIPTGKLHAVENSPLDFRKLQTIGVHINDEFEALKYGGGYDHNFVLDKEHNTLELAAILKEPKSGRVMHVLTTEPGVQLYTANSINIPCGKSGNAYTNRCGLCLETQHFPDAPNQKDFPSTILNPGDIYKSTTIYYFTTD
jgi:aldose 1-epimerase